MKVAVQYLHPTSHGKLEKLLLAVLVGDHHDLLMNREGSGIKSLLQFNNVKALSCIHRLFTRIDGTQLLLLVLSSNHETHHIAY